MTRYLLQLVGKYTKPQPMVRTSSTKSMPLGAFVTSVTSSLLRRVRKATGRAASFSRNVAPSVAPIFSAGSAIAFCATSSLPALTIALPAMAPPSAPNSAPPAILPAVMAPKSGLSRTDRLSSRPRTTSTEAPVIGISCTLTQPAAKNAVARLASAVFLVFIPFSLKGEKRMIKAIGAPIGNARAHHGTARSRCRR